MMRYVFIFLWAALQILFASSFLSSFLEVKRRKPEAFGVMLAAWLMTAVYSLFEVQGIHGYTMYFLMAVMLLLVIHGEYGSKGLCLLICVFLIPVLADTAAQHLFPKALKK